MTDYSFYIETFIAGLVGAILLVCILGFLFY
jgi:uncharacterized membrane protein YeaQ/YmgE (transglycosylase-associated protein family)